MRCVLIALALLGCSSATTNETHSDAGVVVLQDPICQSIPDELASPCESDEDCVGHRCSRTYGHCVWPCASDCDCAQGYHCEAPACIGDP